MDLSQGVGLPRGHGPEEYQVGDALRAGGGGVGGSPGECSEVVDGVGRGPARDIGESG